MKISTKGRYALQMFVDLAEHKDNGFIALKDIAIRQNISKKYLEQIIPVLNKTDILLSNRGTQGGYRLAREPNEYTVAEILKLTEGSLSPVSGIELDDSIAQTEDYTAYVWQGLYKAINDYLESSTIQDIVEHKNSLIGNDYII